jgi:hypothetical protein
MREEGRGPRRGLPPKQGPDPLDRGLCLRHTQASVAVGGTLRRF